MSRVTTCLLATLLIATVSTRGQIRDPRSLSYIFLTSGSDVRATWVNPAGLATVPEASVMGEMVFGKPPGSGFHFEQYTIGMNSRGFSVAYQRDRFDGGPSSNILRLSTALPFDRGAIGVATSWYGVEGPNRRDLDVGLLYRPTRFSAAGLMVRHIGRPDLAGNIMPISVDGGIGIGLLGGRVYLGGEGRATERLGESGYDLSYRAGTYIVIPTRQPVSIIATGNFDSDFEPQRIHLGVAIGGRNSITSVLTALDGSDGFEFDRISVSGVASNILTGR